MTNNVAVAIPSGSWIDVDPRIAAIIRDPTSPQAYPRDKVDPPSSLPGRLGRLENAHTLIGLVRHGVRFAEELRARHGDIYRGMLRGRPAVWIWDAEVGQKILRNDDRAWSTGMGWATSFEKVMGASTPRATLLALDFESHRAARKLVQPAFTPRAIKGYIELAQPLIASEVDAWLAHGVVPFKRTARELLASVANTIFTGITDPAERARLDFALRSFWRGTAAIFGKLDPSLRTAQREFRYMEALFQRLVQERRAAPGDDMLSRLVEIDDPDCTDGDRVGLIIGIMLAAYDTTSCGVTSMAYLLARHPEWQARLREEALRVDTLDWNGLQQLEQLEWAWKETLRLMPVAGVVPRRALRDVELLGHTIPAGCLVLAVTGSLGRSARYWDQPERFDPARFDPARAEDRKHPGMYMPFGAGPHACVGLQLAGIEAKLLFHRLLTRATFELAEDYQAEHTFTPIGVVSGKVALKLTPR
jgi:cytochrome P450